MVHAAQAAVPYLIRLGEWDDAGSLLDKTFRHDPSRANAAATLPALQQIVRHAPHGAGLLAQVLEVLDPAAAEIQMRVYFDDTVARGSYGSAATVAGQLADLCRDSGRVADALTFAEQQADYTRQAGHGPWTQLNCEIKRLQILSLMGQAAQVFTKVQRLRGHMDTLPATQGPDETVPSWQVREILLDAGRHAAYLIGKDNDALDLNAAQIASSVPSPSPSMSEATRMLQSASRTTPSATTTWPGTYTASRSPTASSVAIYADNPASPPFPSPSGSSPRSSSPSLVSAMSPEVPPKCSSKPR
jgi:hypothetical protein